MDLEAKVDAVHDTILGLKPTIERLDVTTGELSQRLRFVEHSSIRHEERIVVLEKQPRSKLALSEMLRSLSDTYDEYHALITLFSLGLTLATVLLHFHTSTVAAKTIQILKASAQQENDR